jgi:hypothetical protein
MVCKQQASMATTSNQTLLLDPGVLIGDPLWREYYQHHVIPHEQRSQAQRLLPPDQQDPYWFMMMELDQEASVYWRLTH